jgi:hypothetical protein
MRQSFVPSIVPNGKHQTVYLLLNDFGQLSRAYCEASEDRSDLETTISDLISGQYDNPVRVIAFNAAERWSKTSRKKSHEKSCAALVLPVTSCRRRCYSITSSAATSSACGAGKLGCECIVHWVEVKMDGGQESKAPAATRARRRRSSSPKNAVAQASAAHVPALRGKKR